MIEIKNSCRGYISSRSFAGNWAPQHIQNLVIRNYCANNNLHYLLSSAEYSIKDSYIVLKDLVRQSKSIEGIVFYSIHQLPEEKKYRNDLLMRALSNKCLVYFCVEDKVLRNVKDLDDLNIILDVYNVVSDLIPLSLN